MSTQQIRSFSHRRRIRGGYISDVLDTGPIAYWPLNEGSGTVARCLVNSAQNGTATGVTWANDATGPFGTPAPFFDGANDWINIYTAALASVFDGAEGTSLIWAKVNAAGVWTDGSNRFTVVYRDDGNNRVFMYKTNVNNRFAWVRVGGGVSEGRDANGLADTDWICVAITWSETLDEVRAFYNGVQEGATMTTLGAFVGPIINNFTNVGSETNAPGSPWHGWLAHNVLWDRALAPSEILALANA